MPNKLTSAERRALRLLMAEFRAGKKKPTPFAVLVKRVGRSARPRKKLKRSKRGALARLLRFKELTIPASPKRRSGRAR